MDTSIIVQCNALKLCATDTKWQTAASSHKIPRMITKAWAGTVSSSLNHFHTHRWQCLGLRWAGPGALGADNHSQAKTHSWEIVIRTPPNKLCGLASWYTHIQIFAKRKYKTQWRRSSFMSWGMCGFESHFVRNGFSRLGAVSPEEILLP